MKKSHTIHPSRGAGSPIKLSACQCGAMHNSGQFCSCSAKKNTSSCPAAEPKKTQYYVLLQNQKIQHLCSAASSIIPTQHEVSSTTTFWEITSMFIYLVWNSCECQRTWGTWSEWIFTSHGMHAFFDSLSFCKWWVIRFSNWVEFSNNGSVIYACNDRKLSQ